jgi:hypothetical protein
MSHARRTIGLCAAVVAWLNAAPAAGQQSADLFAECRPDRIRTTQFETFPGVLASPAVTIPRARERLAATGSWTAAADEVIASFRILADTADLPAAQRRVMEEQLRVMRADLAGNAGSPAGLDNVGRFGSHIEPTGAEFSFGTSTRVIVVEPTEPLPHIRAVCWTAVPADALLHLGNEAARNATLAGLDRAVAAWDAFNGSGYRQYPWELLVNGPGSPLMPPRTQVILMHPGVALELADVDDIDTVRRLDTILLEPIGFLVYNERRTFYGGVSAVVSFPSGESPGIGPMVHLGPWAKAAWVFRRDAPGSPGSGLVVTADLLQVLTDAPAQYRRARDRVEGELRAAVGRLGDGH